MNNKLLLAIALASTYTASVSAEEFTGALVGFNLGYLGHTHETEFSTAFGAFPETITIYDKRDHGASQVITGAHAGYGMQIGPMYIGAEAVADTSSAKTKFMLQATAPDPGANPLTSAKAAELSTHTGNIKSGLGAAFYLKSGVVAGNSVVGVKLGYGSRNIEYTHTILFNNIGDVQSKTVKETATGPAVGFFADVKIDSFVSGIEGNFKMLKDVRLRNTANVEVGKVKTTELDFRVRFSYLLGTQ